MLFAGAVLALSLFTGCKQGNGERCEVASDCQSDFCALSGDPQNGICCDSTNTQTCIVQGGVGGAIGTSGQGGSGGAEADGSSDTTADAPAADGPDDTSGTD